MGTLMKYRIALSSKKENCSVYIASSVREPGKKSPTTVIVKRFGKKSVLLAEDPNALKKIQAEVDELNRKTQIKEKESSLEAVKSFFSEANPDSQADLFSEHSVFASRSLGLFPLEKVYEQLNLSEKFRYLKRSSRIQYDLPEIVRDLTLLRILSPASKLRTSMRGIQDYLGFSSINVEHMYKALDVLASHKTEIVKYLNRQLDKRIANRDTSVCLYDITTYAFESTNHDDLRDFGYSKDKKFNEVQVVMALAADRNGIPLDYSLYKGNQAEGATMVPFIHELEKKFNVHKFIVVADKGLNSKANIDSLVKLGHDYVLSSKVRGASEDIKSKVLDPDGRIPWVKTDADGVVINRGWFKEIELDCDISYPTPEYAFERPSSDESRALKARLKHEKTKSGKTVRSKLHKRYIITWSEARAAKDRKDRERLVKKARKLVETPSDIKAQFKRGGRSFLMLEVNTESASIDWELVANQELFDGIHVIETSLTSPAQEVLDIYGNLWRIEDNFRNLKGTLDARPVFVRLPDHIRGHFLICYMALTVLRYLQHILDADDMHATSDQIVRALNTATVAVIKPNPQVEFYGISGIDPVMKDIFKVCGMDVPNTYETGVSLRKKLKIYNSLNNLFSYATNDVKS